MIGSLHFSTTLILSFLLYLTVGGLGYAIYASMITATFASLPDIDIYINQRTSRIVNFLERFRKNKFLDMLLRIPYKILYAIHKLFTHRGITHTIYFALIFFILAFITKIEILFFIGVAIVFHILEDALTVSGVKPFYPLSNYTLSLRLFSNSETVDIQRFLSKVLIVVYVMLISLFIIYG